MKILEIILLALAALMFLGATVKVASKVELVALGLFFWICYVLATVVT